MGMNDIKERRERTGAGMLDCKKALEESAGNLEKAIDWLRAKGIANAAKKAGRAATEGVVHAYIHGGGRIGVLVEVNSETDFVAKNEMFQQFVNDIAMHIAASAPDYVRREEVPGDVIERERAVQKARVMEEGKPESVAEKIVEGRITKWLGEIVLLDQPFIRDDKKTVQAILTDLVAKIGENIQIRRFTRYVIGEGLEKKQDDFAAEVAKAAGLA